MAGVRVRVSGRVRFGARGRVRLRVRVKCRARARWTCVVCAQLLEPVVRGQTRG